MASNLPIAYKAGVVYFCETPFFVDKRVLIPRFDTELLVETVIQNVSEGAKVLDLCTGSGCVAVVLAKHNYVVTASDISRGAIHVARKNARLNSQSIRFVRGDMFGGLKRGADLFDVIVCNPPYVKTADIGRHDKSTLHEPRISLDGGADGLEFYRRIANRAGEYLAAGGWLVLEIGYNQAKVGEILGGAFRDIKILKDRQGHDRVITCRKG